MSLLVQKLSCENYQKNPPREGVWTSSYRLALCIILKQLNAKADKFHFLDLTFSFSLSWLKPAFPVLSLTKSVYQIPQYNKWFIYYPNLFFLDAKYSPPLPEVLLFLYIQIIHILADEVKMSLSFLTVLLPYLNSYSNYRIIHLAINHALRFSVCIWLPCWFISGVTNSLHFSDI